MNSWIFLELNLDYHSICGAKISDPIGKLQELGPCEDQKQILNNKLIYYSKGLEVGFHPSPGQRFLCSESQFKENTLHEVCVIWKDEHWSEKFQSFQAFQGKCIFGGRKISLSVETTETEFYDIFGPPFWRNSDEDEILLFYEHRQNIEWQVSFSKMGKLNDLTITQNPLMADETQRRLYKVSKVWPPSLL